ncbi:MAG TPA: tetratricopeptide repeat protein [Bryobacteraceae bacterium]|nr:tetratricopeptide repeat protein [Bryobacteraceae bacterium]
MACARDNPLERCLQLIAAGLHYLERGNHESANLALASVLLVTNELPPEEASPLRALALYDLSRLRTRQKLVEEARQLREQAEKFLARAAETSPLPEPWIRLYSVLMADALSELNEHRRAIPHFEKALQGPLDFLSGPSAAADVLFRAGKCYSRVGLRDHAAVPLRAAVQRFRELPGDPRLAAALIALGNALRKSSPAEAESCYKEAAQYHESRAQLESAAPAWVNLGVMCSEQGRFPESLAYYEKALHVRARISGSPPERMGTLLNNIANVQRRMGQFEEAIRTVERAHALLQPVGGHSFACALGTRGLIYRDWGRDADAVDWFRQSAAEHHRQPSPNLETLSEELENESAALERLGQLEEAADARGRLDLIRAARESVAPGVALGEQQTSREGAVLVELDFGIRQRAAAGSARCDELERRLSDALDQQGTGYPGGRVLIPETTTLLFYGEDAETLFATIHPIVLADPICAGARVTVRQQGRHREAVLPALVM